MNTPTPSAFEQELFAFVEQERLESLHHRLAAEAGSRLDIKWFLHETPVGELFIASHDEHVVRVAFAREGFDEVKEQVVLRFGAKMLRTDQGMEFVRSQLEEYFSGRRHSFEIPVDFALSHGAFRLDVQASLPRIDYGSTVSYSQLAAMAGRPKAVRAAASACATNPLPIVVPCHRVVRSDGSTGAYLGGEESKRWLLEHERATAVGA